ncbi:MDR family MFS transporter [Brevibacillus sp. SYSU BS000544]|uniref:MDR family MFS transporter n=1 Tax=Brevibacillus sp. SYSU BS000544 TaxID=3416443 RepID=UPI003CE4755B
MNKIQAYLREYHPIVHILMAGTVFITLTSSMSMPFLAIYLRQTTPLDYATIGMIIGAGPLAGAMGGFVGGMLSDFLGRTRLMVLSLLTLALVFFGLVLTTNPILLTILSIFRGLAGSFFGTISKALMGDLTPEDKRFRMFANRYLAVNLGFSIGPMVGALLGIGGSSLTFVIASGMYVIFALSLVVLFRHMRVESNNAPSEQPLSVIDVLNVLRKDRILFLFLVGGTFLFTVHGQMSVTLSQYLEASFEDGVALFGTLMSINGISVLLLQVPLTRWSEKFSLFQRIVLGSMGFALGEIGFAFSNGWAWFILSMIVFTVGEILVVPAEYAQIDQITPQGMRGTYYGAQSFCDLGGFIGPWVGGMVLASYGGPSMFLLMAAISLASLIFFAKGRQLFLAKTTPHAPDLAQPIAK